MFDTSAWSAIDGRPDSNEAWSKVIGLIEAGRIVSPSEVLKEIKVHEPLHNRLKPYSRVLRKHKKGAALFNMAGDIASQFPSMARIRSNKEVADPWVVAVAKISGYIVVTDENENRRGRRKIPYACRKLNPPVGCMRLDEFLENE